MRRISASFAVICFALMVHASGQSVGQRPAIEDINKELIQMSKRLMAKQTSGAVITDGAVTLTPFGLMQAANVKEFLSASLDAPVVSINGDEAVVTGQVIFKRASGQRMNGITPVRISYKREDGRWKYVGLCLGNCSPQASETRLPEP